MTETAGLTAQPGIGAQLRAARERAGLTTLQAAAKLHLEPRMIEALEAEEFAAIGAAVYVRGHLRRYAELVDAPVGPLLDAYAAREEASMPPDLHRKGQAETIRPSRELAGPVVGVIVAGAVIAGIWLALKGLPSASLPRATPPAATATTAATAPTTGAGPAAGSPVAADTGAADAARSPAPAAALADLPGADAAGETAAATTVAAPPDAGPATAAPVAAPGAMRVRLSFRADSWAEIYDSRNRRLYYDLGQAGTQIAVQGSAPLRVLLGYADGVAVDVEGRALPIPAGARTGRRASFVVTSAGTLTPMS